MEFIPSEYGEKGGQTMSQRGVGTQAVGTAVDTAIETGIQFLESLSPLKK